MVSAFVSLSTSFIFVGIGTISSSNTPLACALAIRCWDSSEYSSWDSRLTL